MNLSRQIAELERTRGLIDKSIANLREAEGQDVEAGATPKAPAQERRSATGVTTRGPLSPEAIRRISIAQKKRHAAARAKGVGNGGGNGGGPAKPRTMRAGGGS